MGDPVGYPVPVVGYDDELHGLPLLIYELVGEIRIQENRQPSVDYDLRARLQPGLHVAVEREENEKATIEISTIIITRPIETSLKLDMIAATMSVPPAVP